MGLDAKKPFPHLVMNGNKICEKAKDALGILGITPTSVDTNINVMIISIWSVVRNIFDGGWLPEDPWPDEAPGAEFHEFHEENNWMAGQWKVQVDQSVDGAGRNSAPWQSYICGDPGIGATNVYSLWHWLDGTFYLEEGSIETWARWKCCHKGQPEDETWQDCGTNQPEHNYCCSRMETFLAGYFENYDGDGDGDPWTWQREYGIYQYMTLTDYTIDSCCIE